jgi:probable DNA metabolism protein
MLSDAVVYYYFDGSMVGLLNCVFRAFQFKEFHVQLCLNQGAQHGLFATVVEIPNHEQHAGRVWSALQQKLSHSSLRQFYFAYLSESLDAYQHLFNYCIYVFRHQHSVEKNYSHPSVLAISQWTKRWGAKSIVWKLLCVLRKPQMGFFKFSPS